MVFLTGGCLCCFYGAAYYYGWDYAIGSYFYDAPMSLGLNFIPAPLMIFLFWMILWGGLGTSYYFDLSEFGFFMCLFPAFLVFLFLMTGSYPQRYLNHYYDYEGYPLHYQKPLLQSIGEVNVRPLQKVQRISESQDRFGDQVGVRGFNNNRGLARALMFQDGNVRDDPSQENDSNYK